MKEYAKTEKESNRVVTNKESKICMLKNIVDNRKCFKAISTQSNNIQKKQNVIQRGLKEAKSLWDKGPHKNIPLTYENVIKYPDKTLIEAWNLFRPATIVVEELKDGKRTSTSIVNPLIITLPINDLQKQRTEWNERMDNVSHSRSAILDVNDYPTPLEKYMHHIRPDSEIDYSIAYIGSDHWYQVVYSSGKKSKILEYGKLKDEVEKLPRKPFTLVSLLRDVNSEWGVELNNEFIKMILINCIPVSIADPFFLGVAEKWLEDNHNRSGLFSGNDVNLYNEGFKSDLEMINYFPRIENKYSIQNMEDSQLKMEMASYLLGEFDEKHKSYQSVNINGTLGEICTLIQCGYGLEKDQSKLIPILNKEDIFCLFKAILDPDLVKAQPVMANMRPSVK